MPRRSAALAAECHKGGCILSINWHQDTPEDGKRHQKLMLSDDPGLKDYFSERAAVDAKTEKLRALRLAKAETALSDKPAETKTPRQTPKRAARRGLGSS